MSADAGLARERTALAWRRTAMAFAVNAVLLLHSPHVSIQIAALGALAFATALAAGAARKIGDPNSSGWLAGRARGGAVLVVLAAAVGIFDMAAIVF